MDLKIIITTVFNSNNFGSFLQARELKRALNEYDTVFYDSKTRSQRATLINHIKKLIKHTRSIGHILRGTIFEIAETIKLYRCWHSLPHTQNPENRDVMILGSDEIWNLSRKRCRHPIYWGDGFDGYKIAYAPSANQATEEEFRRYPEYLTYLNRIDTVSVRDSSTAELIAAITDQQPPVVLDPTLLCDPQPLRPKKLRPYIAVYFFYERLKKEEVAAIREFADRNGYLLVSAGQYISWCDRSIHSIKGNPFYIFENAAFVITNTFHGTAYSINYRKQFASFANSNKVLSLLEEFGLQNRAVTEDRSLESILRQRIDLSDLEEKLSEKREFSREYLNRSLMSAAQEIGSRR